MTPYVLAALLLHAPLTPLGALAGLLALATRPPEEPLPVEALNALPIDLLDPDLGERPDPPAAPAPTPAAEPDEVPAPPPVRRRRKAERPDAGVAPEHDDGGAPAGPDGGPEAGPETGAASSAGPDPVAPASASAVPSASAAPPPPASTAPPAPSAPADAGGPGPVASASVDGGAGPAGSATPATSVTAPAGSASGGTGLPAPAGSGTGRFRDPVGVAGSAARVADSNANVRLLLHLDRLRGHHLGPKVGSALAATYQWREFFGPSGLDPVRDLDRLLLAGPQLRDSSQIVAVAQHRLSGPKMRQAVDALVKATPDGRWGEGAVPVAHVKVDRAERVIALPASQVVVVAPPALEKQVVALGPKARLAAGPKAEILTVYLVTPWRALRGVPFEVPKTLAWVRIAVETQEGGSVIARLEAKDASPEKATDDARSLERALRGVVELRGLAAALVGQSKLVESVRFRAEGDRVLGEVVATDAQLSYLIGLVASYARQVADDAARRKGRPAPSASAR